MPIVQSAPEVSSTKPRITAPPFDEFVSKMMAQESYLEIPDLGKITIRQNGTYGEKTDTINGYLIGDTLIFFELYGTQICDGMGVLRLTICSVQR